MLKAEMGEKQCRWTEGQTPGHVASLAGKISRPLNMQELKGGSANCGMRQCYGWSSTIGTAAPHSRDTRAHHCSVQFGRVLSRWVSLISGSWLPHWQTGSRATGHKPRGTWK